MKTAVLSENRIAGGLRNRIAVEVLETVDSTSTELRLRIQNGLDHPLLLLAEEQTAGRGRHGHSFYSPKYEGLYFSLAYPVPEIGTDALLRVTAKTAVAAARGVERTCGIPLAIKWVNDLYMDRMKVGGILTECVNSHWLIIGIGLNVTTSIFPGDLVGKAKGLNPFGDEEMDQNQPTPDFKPVPDRNELAVAIVDALLWELEHPEDQSYLTEYRSRSNVIGKTVVFSDYRDGGSLEERGTAVGIEDDGALFIKKEDGTMIRLDSGEIRVRTLKGEF